MLFAPAPPRFAVGNTPDLERVLALPRRAEATPDEVAAWSAALNTQGRQLFPKQVEALREIYYWRGLAGPMRVGSGKTLVSLLAPTVLGIPGSEALLVVPGKKLQDKTRAEFAAYAAQGWRVTLPELISYQKISHANFTDAALLAACSRLRLLILDEAHKARDRGSACTRKLRRAIETLRPIVAVLSGTLITDQLEDYHHLLVWALGARAPVPLHWADAEVWAKALDRDVGLLERHALGALERLPGGFHEHLRGSAGVVATPGSDCEATIEIRRWRPELPKILVDALAYVESTKARPDGEPLDEWDLPDYLCQIAGGGFYYVWDPLPPDWWLAPRRGWNMYKSAIVTPKDPADQIDGLDSPLQLVRALDRCKRHGPGPWAPPAWQEGCELLAMWRAVDKRFVPNPVPVWLDDSPLRQAAQAEPGTLIWTRHVAAGQRLAQLGVPYYGAGSNPESAPHGTTIALSVSAHGTGFNLQHGWSRNRVISPMASAELWEQLVGRTHRQGQRAPIVHVEVPDSIDYHRDVLSRVMSRTRAVSKFSGFDYKLLAARWIGSTN